MSKRLRDSIQVTSDNKDKAGIPGPDPDEMVREAQKTSKGKPDVKYRRMSAAYNRLLKRVPGK